MVRHMLKPGALSANLNNRYLILPCLMTSTMPLTMYLLTRLSEKKKETSLGTVLQRLDIETQSPATSKFTDGTHVLTKI